MAVEVLAKGNRRRKPAVGENPVHGGDVQPCVHQAAEARSYVTASTLEGIREGGGIVSAASSTMRALRSSASRD